MLTCKYCGHHCIKKGFQKNGMQRYQCKSCNKYSQSIYQYKGCENNVSDNIINLNNEGMGIRSIARFLKISATTVIQRIRHLSKPVKVVPPFECNQEYELDEMWTYCGNKSNGLFITYAINRHSKKVIDFIVGKRTNENLEKIINTISLLNPSKIYTDGLNIYPTIIPERVHKRCNHLTNHIERLNLTLRTHLKRLSRSTISFSKKADMLEACLKLYFLRRCL